jgi:KDO2-lipid IV(A) lauroyltransferase
MTQAMADAFAAAIAAHPADWHMLQRLWQDDLDPGRGNKSGNRNRNKSGNANGADVDAVPL